MKAQLFAFLKGLPPLVYVVVGVLTFTGASLAVYGAKQRQIGALNAEIAQQEHDNRTLRMAQDSLEKAQKPQTVAAVKWHTKWNTLKAGVDTQWLKPDSVPVPVEVVRTIVVTADSAIRTCTQALQTCEARVLNAQQGWANARAEIAKIKATIPSKGQKWIYGLAGLGTGYVLGRIVR